MNNLASAIGGASVELSGIRKRYGPTPVLQGVDLDIPAGSFTTLLGPSGSGKTTLLSITTGLVAADEGTVRIDGQDCTDLSVHKRNLGFVFQSYALFPHMSIERNIMFPLLLRKVKKAEARRRAAEALELVKLESFAKRYPNQLSGGQQQRVALARAVVFEPRVLLMDEPLGALDAGLRTHLQREIVRIGRELGVTILYVTHDQDEALSMSSQIALFSNGRIEQVGSPSDIYCLPRSEFVANFIGSGSVVGGVFEHRGGDAGVVAPDGTFIRVDEESVRRSGLGNGDAAAAVVRPECVDHQRPGSSSPVLGRGRITDLVYAGRRIRVNVDIAGWPAIEHHCEAVEAFHLRIGDELTIVANLDRLPAVIPRGHARDDEPPAGAATEPMLDAAPV